MTEELIQKPGDTLREKCLAPYKFTTEEIGELGKQLSATSKDAKRVEAELSSIKKEYAAKLETIELTADSICRKLDDGFEMREAFAIVTFNDPTKGRKVYRHEDSGEFIREEAMSHADFQLPMFRAADGTDATQPELPAAEIVTALDEEGDVTEHANAEEPAGTPLAEALDQAASLSEAPLLKLDLSKYTAEGHLLTAYRKAAVFAGWQEAQIAMLKTQLQACDTVSRMREVLAPHCQPVVE